VQVPLKITFRGMDTSEALEARIREKTDKLEQFYDRITSCRVVVEAPHRHSNKGKLYTVSIGVTLPGGELTVNTEKRLNHAHEDVYVALRDAFSAMQRQIEDFGREQRAEIKTHEAPPHGVVRRMFPDHGFIETPDRGDIFFHRNSVVDGSFDALTEGTAVRFTAVPGDKGLQASSVYPIGKHHPVGNQS